MVIQEVPLVLTPPRLSFLDSLSNGLSIRHYLSSREGIHIPRNLHQGISHREPTLMSKDSDILGFVRSNPIARCDCPPLPRAGLTFKLACIQCLYQPRWM
jgi:hypothetical protein